MMTTACLNSFIILTNVSSHSISILLIPCILLSTSEIVILFGSLLFFFEEAPRRIQAILLSLVFLSRYCGSLVYYGLLPGINALCKVASDKDSLPHYEFALSLISVVVIIGLGVLIWKAVKYQYVTEQELDKECAVLRPDRILHPYIVRANDIIK